MAMTHARQNDPTDPHHFHEDQQHGHVIVSPWTLLGVLLALLFFTFLTVFAARAETWVAEAYDMAIPHWFNASVALGIAVIKATLVCLFFMQLKYDNPLNSLIFLFCLFAVALFLGFSMLDLSTQGLIYSWEGEEITAGGTQISTPRQEGDIVPRTGTAIVVWAREEWQAEWAVDRDYVDAQGNPTPDGLARAEEAWEEMYAEHHAADHGFHEGPVLSTAEQSRPRDGLTPGLFDPAGKHDASAGHEEPASHSAGH